jgi:hypothetical protein
MGMKDAEGPKKQMKRGKGAGKKGKKVENKGQVRTGHVKGKSGMDAQSMTPFSRPAGGTSKGRSKAKKKKKDD